MLGIDIGGTGIKGAIVNVESGTLVTDRHKIATPQPATPESVIATVKELVDRLEWKGKIGCGFPAAVKHEIVKTASNIDDSWIGVNAATEIEKVTGCKAHVINDVDAAGQGEVAFGAGKGMNGTIMMVALGTGIGTAIFSEGQLLPNTELGHLKLHGKIAEHYAANSIREKEDLGWKEFGKRVNEYLQLVEFLFWPDMIIIGGGVSKKYENFSKHFDVECEVAPATLRNNAGIIGAALAAHRDL